MRHSVLLKSLEYSNRKGRDFRTDIHAAPPFLVVSRQVFNALSPLIVGHKTLVRLFLPRNFTHKLLMRADSFRFATSVVFDEQCTTDQARPILSRLDVVLHVDPPTQSDALVPLLLRLPHLRTVDLRYARGMTYAGTVRPLLKHPNECLRRHVAQYVMLALVSRRDQFDSAIRHDIIPLLDSATTNGAISDYLQAFPSNDPELYWVLSRDSIRLLCTRVFSYLMSPTAHRELLEHLLKILCHCADQAAKRAPLWEMDVFAEWPVLDRVLELYRSGRLQSERFGAIWRFLKRIFQSGVHKQQFYDSGVLAVLSEGIKRPTRLLDRNSALGSLVESARVDSPLQLLKSSIPCILLRCTLVPLHERVMSEVLRFQRCGADEDEAFCECHHWSLSSGERRDFKEAIGFFLSFLTDVAKRVEPDSKELHEQFNHIVHLLFDEEQFHLGPILRTYLLIGFAQRMDAVILAKACELESGVTTEARHDFWNCMGHEEKQFAACRRRIREELATSRCYLAEFCEDRKVRRILCQARTT